MVGISLRKKYFVLFSDCLCVCLRLCACVFSVRVDVFCVLVCFLHFQWLLLTLPTSAFFQLSLLLSGIWDLVLTGSSWHFLPQAFHRPVVGSIWLRLKEVSLAGLYLVPDKVELEEVHPSVDNFEAELGIPDSLGRGRCGSSRRPRVRRGLGPTRRHRSRNANCSWKSPTRDAPIPFEKTVEAKDKRAKVCRQSAPKVVFPGNWEHRYTPCSWAHGRLSLGFFIPWFWQNCKTQRHNSMPFAAEKMARFTFPQSHWVRVLQWWGSLRALGTFRGSMAGSFFWQRPALLCHCQQGPQSLQRQMQW